MSDPVLVILNALLVVVTATYAWITFNLARSSDRSAAAGERAAASAAEAAEQSRAAVEVQRAALAVQRASQPMGFVLGAAGPFDSGFGFVLRTDGGSYLVREVNLQNITFKPLGTDHPGVTFGMDLALQPRQGALPMQLDPPDSLVFEVPDAAALAERALGDADWGVEWWNVLVLCSFSENDPAVRRVLAWSQGRGQSIDRTMRGDASP